MKTQEQRNYERGYRTVDEVVYFGLAAAEQKQSEFTKHEDFEKGFTDSLQSWSDFGESKEHEPRYEKHEEKALENLLPAHSPDQELQALNELHNLRDDTQSQEIEPER